MAAVLATVVLGAGTFIFAPPSGADVPSVTGSAYGYFTNVSLFGGPTSTRGPEPTVTLPASGSAVPLTAASPSGSAVYGPAVLFQSGPIMVSTQGTTGPTGSATSWAHILGYQDPTDPDPAPDGPGPFRFREVTSTCFANETGVTGSTTIVGGILETKYDPVTQLPTATEPVALNPAPNDTRTGTIDHVGDSYRIVFNEQVVNPDGSLTVNAAHMYLLGPIAVGELIIGQSVCGVTAAGPTTTAETATSSVPTTSPATTSPAATSGKDDEPATTTSLAASATGETEQAAALRAATAAVTVESTTTTTALAGATASEQGTVAAATLQGASTLFFAAADVSRVAGGAFGYYTNVSLFGGPASPQGPAPKVDLPATGADPPLTATAPSGTAQYGPAVIFQSGPITVTTGGKTGPQGSVASSTDIQGITDGPGPFLYQRVRSSCTATETGALTGSATITGGKLETKYDPVTQDPTVTENVPVTPSPNYTRTGTLDHIGDSYRIVFNEQTTTDGVLTVNAAHMYLLGPIARGDLIVGQSRCGATVTASTTSQTSTTLGTSSQTSTTAGTTSAQTGSSAGTSTTAGSSGSSAPSTVSSSGSSAVAASTAAGANTQGQPGSGSTAGNPLAHTGAEAPVLPALALLMAALAARRGAGRRRYADLGSDEQSRQ